MTPTLARMVAARHRDYRKPMKWFCVPPFFRYEKQQRGRLREFWQLNCDLFGDNSPARRRGDARRRHRHAARASASAPQDFVVRLSDRDAWARFAAKHGVAAEKLPELLAVVDKLERTTA